MSLNTIRVYFSLYSDTATIFYSSKPEKSLALHRLVRLYAFVPQSTDTQPLARDTTKCARSTYLDIMVQMR